MTISAVFEPPKTASLFYLSTSVARNTLETTYFREHANKSDDNGHRDCNNQMLIMNLWAQKKNGNAVTTLCYLLFAVVFFLNIPGGQV